MPSSNVLVTWHWGKRVVLVVMLIGLIALALHLSNNSTVPFESVNTNWINSPWIYPQGGVVNTSAEADPLGAALTEPRRFSTDAQRTSTDAQHTSPDAQRTSPEASVSEKCIKRLPQAIIVGIQKCGTTALNLFLNEHPQIVACMHPSETQYFSAHYGRPLSWYRNLMPCSYSDQITIEKSPPYFYRPFCAERIKKMNPKTKIIIVVKDPIVRAQSMYAMKLAHSNNPSNVPPFTDRVLNEFTSVNKKSIMVRFSTYPALMQKWLSYFDLKQICIVDGHALETDPAQELAKVERFLGVGSYFTPDLFTFNATKGKYCFSKFKDTSCLAENKGREHPKLNKNALRLLQEHFKPLNERFFDLIKQRFNWGY